MIRQQLKRRDFDLGNVNDNILRNYIITDCLAWGNFGHEKFRGEIVKIDVTNLLILGIEYKINVLKPFVEPYSPDASQAVVQLPSGDKLYRGFSLRIFREKNEEYNLVVKPFNECGFINKETQVMFSDSDPELTSKEFIFDVRFNDQDFWYVF